MSEFLDKAVQAHVQWKIRLLTAINSGSAAAIDRRTVCADCNCDLGKWIHGDGTAHGADPAFAALKESHRKFHLSIGQVIELATSGRMAEAKVALQSGEFARYSNETVQHIARLKQHATIHV